MAGHSKWANIQHRKGRQDAKRGKLWTKIIREITVAARAGGADPDANPRLRIISSEPSHEALEGRTVPITKKFVMKAMVLPALPWWLIA